MSQAPDEIRITDDTTLSDKEEMTRLDALPAQWRALVARQRSDQFEAVVPYIERFKLKLSCENTNVQRAVQPHELIFMSNESISAQRSQRQDPFLLSWFCIVVTRALHVSTSLFARGREEHT